MIIKLIHEEWYPVVEFTESVFGYKVDMLEKDITLLENLIKQRNYADSQIQTLMEQYEPLEY